MRAPPLCILTVQREFANYSSRILVVRDGGRPLESACAAY